MYTKLDLVYVSIITALGLGCAVRTGVGDSGANDDTGSSASESSSSASTSASTTTTTAGDGDPTGDGDGDLTGDGDPTGDGDGDPGPAEPFACLDPQPILQANTEVPSGFVTCEGGFIHRAEAVACVDPQQPDNDLCVNFAGCSSAADCLEAPHASCQLGFSSCACQYGCVTDADCGDGMACVCAGVISELTQCVPTGCETDLDCGDGLCGVSRYKGICEDWHTLACAGPDDECHTDDECEAMPCDPRSPGGSIPYHCTEGNEGFSCQPPGWCNGDCGRPFLVEGEARVAITCARSDWRHALEPAPVDPETAAALAAYWSRVGQLEHASVASFARALGQLLSLGAPPPLVADTQRAMIDEVEHARLSFGLASAYAGQPIGPGPLALERSLTAAHDPRAIVEGLVREACVGETLAALEADQAARAARDPAVARVLEQIAADELRHAQLGWRCLGWLLDTHPALRPLAVDCLANAIANARQLARVSATQAPIGPSLARFGVLDPAAIGRYRLEILDRVIEPAARSLAAHQPARRV